LEFFVFSILLVAGLGSSVMRGQSSAAVAAKVRIVLVGDSTVNSGGGWGAAFCGLLRPNVECINLARNGRSSKSFYDEGLWKNALAEHGDYILIQFGHNDMAGKGPLRETDPETTYAANMRRYIAEARAAGAKPVIVTSLSRRSYADGKLVLDLKPYADAARRVAAEENAPVIDLNAESVKLLESMTQEAAQQYDAAAHPDAVDKGPDRTHLNATGAAVFARMVADDLGRVAVELKPYILAVNAQAALVECNPRGYGAKGDGVSKDTIAIQKAIDACAGQGGGVVRLTAGTYLSAPVVLKSNVTLQLDKGATLFGSSDHADYAARTEFREPGLQSLVSATNATNVAITGEGVIDGNGETWWAMARAVKNAGVMGSELLRPRLVVFDHCKHVRVEGVTIQNSPMWQLVPYYSDDVVIRNIKVLAPQHSPNTDAIDPFSSSHVVIDHVLADVGDDDIAIKSGAINSPGPDDPSTGITITDCTFLHGHGLSVGSEIAGGAQNIVAKRIRFEGTDNGIRVKANRDRGNDVSHLLFRDIQMKDVKNALIISEYYPKVLPPETEAAQPITRLTPHFHDIVLEDVKAVGSTSAGAIVGLPESPVKGVVLSNVKISAQTGLIIGYAEVSGEAVVIDAAEGEGISKQVGAKVALR
jgi:lysophospholipase L1-like esterase